MEPKPNSRILVVDDSEIVVDLVRATLEGERFLVDEAGTAAEALRTASRSEYDLFVLDVGLPDANGYDLCRRLRAFTDAPILFLSARDTELDKVVGLEAGGDDYLAKPFGMRELAARTRALLRRGERRGSAKKASETLRAGDMTLDADGRTAAWEGRGIDLTSQEFELLAYLMRNKGRVVTVEELLREAWGWKHVTPSRTVSTHVNRLRGKLKAAGCDPRIVRTVRGRGFRLDG